MYRRTLAAAAALSCILAGPAEAQQTMIGVKGGVVVADVDVTDIPDLGNPDTRKDLVAGIFLQVPLAGAVSIQPEILFVRKGFEDSSSPGSELRLDYVQVPLLLQFHVVPAGPVSPRVYFGPSLSFEAACTIAGSDIEGTQTEADCADQGVDTENADFGLAFGGGLDVSLGGLVLTGDVRYDLGVTDLNASQDEGSAKNRAWEFMAGIGFPFGP